MAHGRSSLKQRLPFFDHVCGLTQVLCFDVRSEVNTKVNEVVAADNYFRDCVSDLDGIVPIIYVLRRRSR